ncbi:MAG TPA: murein biosynthesis integral membrane protein MurJ [Caulobacteraceae bacterium]|jgi:putative peptidoglycan lipid II flippase
MIRSSLVFGGWTMVSRLMGFARDIVATAYIGASATIAGDAYNTALSFPNLFRRIFAEGAFAAAFVPAYSRTLQEKGEAEADRVATDAMATMTAITTVLTVIAIVAMPWLMRAINPGFIDTPEKFDLAVLLTRISMPYLPAMTIVALLSGVLNARGRFVVSAVAPTILNLFMLIAILPMRDPEAAALAASWGVVAAGVGQVALSVWGIRKAGARIILLRMPTLTPEVRSIILLAVPGAIAASATQINVFVSQALSSQVDGARSWLSTADRLYQLPLGMIGVAVGVALLPQLSRAVQAKDVEGQQTAMDDATTFSLALTLPAAAALLAMPYFLIDALFTRGEFTDYDARNTAAALFHYGWGVPAFVLTRVFTPAFFARRDMKAPMYFAIASVVVNIVLGVGLFYLIGVPGLAIATSAAAWANVVLMATTLWRRNTWRPGADAVRRLTKVLVASVVMGLVLLVAAANRGLLEAPVDGVTGGHGGKELAVLVVSGLGALIYFALLFATRAVTVGEVKRALRGRRGGSLPAGSEGG